MHIVVSWMRRMVKPGDLGALRALSALWVIRGQTATCLCETTRRAEAIVYSTRRNLKGANIDLGFYG
jgi:hypothetical protein